MKKIFICCGHGKNGERFDPGAVSKNGETTERSVVVGIGKKMKELIQDERVVFVNIDENLNHYDRVNKVNTICKQEKLDHTNSLFIELHADWYGSTEGVMAYYYSGYEPSKKISETFSKNLAFDTSRSFKYVKGDDKARQGTLYVIDKTIPLAILLEVGSLRADDNKKDGLEYISGEIGQSDIAKSLSKTLKDEYGIKTKDESPLTDEEFKNDEIISGIKEVWEDIQEKKEGLSDSQQNLHSIAEKRREELRKE